jgi:hypothetical protein
MKVAALLPRTALIALLATVAAAVASGTAAGAPASAAKVRSAVAPTALKNPYDARLLSCRRSPRADLRTAVIGASMRPVYGGRRLSLKVDLYQRPLSGGRWALRSDVPGLSVWSTPSDPSIGTRSNDVFKYRYAVGRLVVPFAYRFRVSFRWSDAGGAVIREETATTAPCKEIDLRPDLVVDDVVVDPAGTDAAAGVYTVVVRNAGRTAARNIGVGSTYSPAVRSIARLDPLQSTELTFFGPACVVGRVAPTFLLDPANTIEEARETNNSLAATCPATLVGP